MPEENSSSPTTSQRGYTATIATRTPTSGGSGSLCDLCSHSLILDDSHYGKSKISPDGAIGTLSFPDSKESFYLVGGNESTRTVTNPDLPELSDPAEKGCRFCAALKGALLDRYESCDWWSSTTLKIKLMIDYVWDGKREAGKRDSTLSLSSLCVTVDHMKDPFFPEFNFPISANEGQCRDWLRIKKYPLDLEGPMSERNIGLVRRWLEECTTDKTCNKFRNKGNFLPKRLLDLGLVGEAGPPILINTTQSPPERTVEEDNLRYACLSYCWGSGPLPLRTTSWTLEEHKRGIPVDKIPKVFSDALFVTRKLGIRYLWIDALCIIQDSESDWEEESGKMAEIFHHSFITFGAATSSDCDETFLPRREDHSMVLDFRSSLNPAVSGRYSIFLLPVHMFGPLRDDISKSVWNTRGWVWQEQNMAQRILIFGSRMLHLRCHQRILSENGYHTADNIGASAFQRPNLVAWKLWMVHYSRRKFTHSCDKLAAVSGFAKSLQKILDKEGQAPPYLAGHWLDHYFHRSLIWILVGDHHSFKEMMDSLETKQDYCAPSWSWASREQEITYDPFPRELDERFEVLRHNLIPATSDAMVKVKSGSSITVQGKILQMRHRPSDGGFSPEPRDAWHPRNIWKLVDPGGEIRCYLDWDPHLGYDGHFDQLLHFIVTGNRKKHEGVESGFAYFSAGLILYPVGLGADMVFFRVGKFEVLSASASLWPIRNVTIL